MSVTTFEHSSTVEYKNTNFAWDNKSHILPVCLIAVPLAIQAISLAVSAYRNPADFKKKFAELKERITDPFKQRIGESDVDFKKRLRKNIFFTVCALIFIAGACACPFFLLPSALAIPAAIAIIQTCARIYINRDKIPKLYHRVKDYLKDAFTMRAEESKEDFQVRRKEAIKKIIKYSLIFAAVVVVACYAGHLISLAAQASSVWAMMHVLPMQTPTVVLLEYLAVGTLHGVQAVRAWKKGDKGKAAMHITAALLSIALPLKYLCEHEKMRLHHSFTGLLLMLTPWNATQALGAMITFDSCMYQWMGSDRGTITAVTTTHTHMNLPNGERRSWVTSFGEDRFRYDIMNVIYDQLPFVLTALTTMCMVQDALSWFTKKSEKEKDEKQVAAVAVVEPKPVQLEVKSVQNDAAKQIKINFAKKVEENRRVLEGLRKHYREQKIKVEEWNKWWNLCREMVSSDVQKQKKKAEAVLQAYKAAIKRQKQLIRTGEQLVLM